ncbi:MAG TPA: translation initiation factor [Planctomycetaceae bacterium]|nr:translation initiation factor [Planctomycetaceae bacterium]
MRLLEGTPFDRPLRCEKCEELEENCTCEPEPPPRTPPSEQTATIALEKRKKGKQMTVVRGLTHAGNDLPALLTKLKSTCGAGGTLDGETLEIQGDHRTKVAVILRKIGYRVK